MSSSGGAIREQLAVAYRQFCLKYEYDRNGTPAAKKKHFENCIEVMVRLSQQYQQHLCVKCGFWEFTRRYGSCMGRCAFCKKVQALTGTIQFFHRVKSPSERLFFFEAMRLGIDFNAKQFSDTVGKSSNVGSELFKKINQSNWQKLKREKRLTSAPLPEYVHIFTDRSMLKPWTKNERTVLRYLRQNQSNPIYKIMLDIYQLLSKEPVSIDVICNQVPGPIGPILGAITALELDGVCVIEYGERVSRA